MLKILPCLTLAGILSAPVISNELSNRSPRIDPVPSQPPPHSHEGPAPVCATGCSAATTPVEGLSEEAFEELLEQYSEHAFDQPSPALETLLFHSAEVRELAERLGLGALDAEHAEFLEREVEHGHARLSVRMRGAARGGRRHVRSGRPGSG